MPAGPSGRLLGRLRRRRAGRRHRQPPPRLAARRRHRAAQAVPPGGGGGVRAGPRVGRRVAADARVHRRARRVRPRRGALRFDFTAYYLSVYSHKIASRYSSKNKVEIAPSFSSKIALGRTASSSFHDRPKKHLKTENSTLILWPEQLWGLVVAFRCTSVGVPLKY